MELHGTSAPDVDPLVAYGINPQIAEKLAKLRGPDSEAPLYFLVALRCQKTGEDPDVLLETVKKTREREDSLRKQLEFQKQQLVEVIGYMS